MPTVSQRSTSSATRIILLAGLIASILDILAAFVTNGLRGISPLRILQSVASGVLGADSYKGGVATAALGLVLHFIIATGATTVYYFASRKFTWLIERAVVCGLLYGVAVYAFMNLIVLPLSAFPHKIAYTLGAVAQGMSIIMLCIGLPIALLVRRFNRKLLV